MYNPKPIKSLLGRSPRGIVSPISYIWSKDNLAELNKGWIMKARTIEELGTKITADPDNDGLMSISNLRANIKRYNQFCRDGEDLDFHREKSSLAPLEDPPYYATKLWPGGPNTNGGPRRNKNAQVVHPDKSPVPRLYSAGELGSLWSMLYIGGGNLGENIYGGRLAAQNAAAEKPWK